MMPRSSATLTMYSAFEFPAFGELVEADGVGRAHLHDLLQTELEELPFYLQQVGFQIARNLDGEIPPAPFAVMKASLKPARHQFHLSARLGVEMVGNDQHLRFEIFRQVAQFAVKLAFGKVCQLGKIGHVDDVPLKIVVLPGSIIEMT